MKALNTFVYLYITCTQYALTICIIQSSSSDDKIRKLRSIFALPISKYCASIAEQIIFIYFVLDLISKRYKKKKIHLLKFI